MGVHGKSRHLEGLRQAAAGFPEDWLLAAELQELLEKGVRP